MNPYKICPKSDKKFTTVFYTCARGPWRILLGKFNRQSIQLLKVKSLTNSMFKKQLKIKFGHLLLGSVYKSCSTIMFIPVHVDHGDY